MSCSFFTRLAARRLLSALAFASIVSSGGCGSAPPPEPAPAPPAEASTSRRSGGQMAVSGITGSLSDREAHEALDPHMDAFATCFHEHGRRVRMLGGEVRFHIAVAPDGSVRTAYPEDSTIGHRAVERCLTDVVTGIRFPRPHGGEASVTYPIGMDPPRGREPTEWEADVVSNVLERRSEGLLEACRPEGHARLQVTAYVRRGRVVSVGVATNEESGLAALDCVAREVRRWRMPVGRRVSKVTFVVR